MANTNLSRSPPRIDYRDEMVKWCRELLLSQRKMIQRGEYTDFGSVMSYQLSQTGRGLIPAIYITSRLLDPSQDPNSGTILREAQELLVLAYDLLRQLASRFSASNRQLQIMQSAFRRLDLSLKKRHKATASGSAGAAHDDAAHGSAANHSTDATASLHAAEKESTSGLDLIAGVAGAKSMEAADQAGSSNSVGEDDDDFEDELDRDKGCKCTDMVVLLIVLRLTTISFTYRDLGSTYQSAGGEDSPASCKRLCRLVVGHHVCITA